MRNEVRLSALAFVLLIGIACGSPSEQQAPPAGSALTGDAPAAGAPGAPASTPGAEMRGEGSAAAPAREPVATTMPMDVPAGTDLVLTLETPVSSETAKPEVGGWWLVVSG